MPDMDGAPPADESEVLYLRIPIKLKTELRNRAVKNRRKINAEATLLLEKAMEDEARAL